jgi:hypothetical protein
LNRGGASTGAPPLHGLNPEEFRMSQPEWPAENPWSADPAPAIPNLAAPAVPVQPSLLDMTAADTSYGAPATPAPSYPAPSHPTASVPAPAYPAPAYPAPAYPAPGSTAPAYPAQPAAFGYPGQPAAPAYPAQPAAPAYGTPAPTAEFPAPVSGYPAPVSGYPVPVSGYPVPPGGYPVPASAVPASPAAAYPTAYPATAPYPPVAPVRKGRAGLVVVSILAALFLVAAAGTGYLYLSKSKDYDRQAAQLRDKENTISNQAGQITTLTSNLADANEKATRDESQLTTLNTGTKALSTCITDYDDLLTKLAHRASSASVDKAINKVDKDCAVADRYRD